MAELLGAAALVLVMLAYLVASWLLRTENGGFWAAAWALLTAAGACVLVSDYAPPLFVVAFAFGSIFPFAILAGAMRYGDRPVPEWIGIPAVAMAGTRAGLAAVGAFPAAGLLALAVEPAVVLVAARIVSRAARRRSLAHRAMAPGLVALAAVEGYDALLPIFGSSVAAPWIAWVLVAIPLAALQILAALEAMLATRARAEKALRERDAQLRDTERAAHIGSFSWRYGSNVVTCSEETLRILGVEGGPDVPIARLFARLPAEREKGAREIYTSLLATREPLEAELRIVLDDGAERVLRERVEMVVDEDGKPIAVNGTVRDVTEAIRSAEALRQNEERLRAILSSLSSTRVAVLSRSGRVRSIYGDRGSGRHYGLPPLDSAKAGSFLAPGELEASRRILEEVTSRGETRELRRSVDFPNGRFWFDATLSPLREPTGDVRDVLVVARDVTEQVHAEEERRRVESALAQSQRLESLGVLAGGIAHDFNNLLVGILGNAELALKAVGPSSSAFELVSDVRAASERASALTQQLLAYAGKTVVSPRTLDLAALVSEMLPLLRTGLPAGANLDLEVAEGGGPFVHADEAQLGQVVMNLVSNAVEALGPPGGEVRVRVSGINADEALLAGGVGTRGLEPGPYASIEVSDTGCGIASEALPRIFDPFFTTKFSGRGLGLASLVGIVRSHGGSVRVESEVGRGSRFQVLLPAVGTPAMVQPAAPDRAAPVRRARLLLVDDEALVRKTASRMLRAEGFEVDDAADAAQALEQLAADPDGYAVALIDLTMPDTDGVRLLDLLREVRADLPVVLMSGHGNEELLERIAGRHGVACLAKPFRLPALADAIAWVLASPTPP